MAKNKNKLLRYVQFWFFRKASGNSSFTTLFSRKCSCYVLLIDQISLFDCVFFLKYWAWPKRRDKHLNILWTRQNFKVNPNTFFINFKGLSVVKNCFRPASVPLSNRNRPQTHDCLVGKRAIHHLEETIFNQGSTNLIFACTDFHASKMVLRSLSWTQHYVCIKQSLWTANLHCLIYNKLIDIFFSI